MRRLARCVSVRQAPRVVALAMAVPVITALAARAHSSSLLRPPPPAPSLPARSTTALAQPRRWCSHDSCNTTLGSPTPQQSATKVDVSQTTTEGNAAVAEASSQTSFPLSAEDVQRIVNVLRDPSAQKSSMMGGPGLGIKDGDMLATFTCGRCDYRMVKRFSKHAYTKGIVIVECPNCHVKHLLADHLGWLEEKPWTIEDQLRERKEHFVHIGSGDYVVSPDDVTTAPPAE